MSAFVQHRIYREAALQFCFEMGQNSARQGRALADCPLTDAECRARWADGFRLACIAMGR